MEQLTDEALVDRVRQGDQDAFRLLVDRNKSGVYSLIRCRVEGHETAEDLAQEVFLKLYRSLSGFRGDSRLSTWMYRLALNAVSDHLRTVRRRPVLAVIDAVKGWMGDPKGQPEEQALLQEERETVVTLLRRLPEKYREALFLYHYRQMSSGEIAQLLGLPVKTVETRLLRGKSMLKQQWLEVYGSEPTTSGRPDAGALSKL
ncbi:RNA polymerase sigma factor [Gorillibacterium sp. sgz5001074]|uniref:RNA polymerase sigma factor n=1 Tax=Gorillibacterium sp. sgz5001074 TaxID=3446695 RepID=UPI003F672317